MRKVSKNKLISGIIACTLAAALLIGGTFAFIYRASVVNEIKDTYKEVVGHDDFDGENKDVYMENTGNTAVWMRIKLTEDFFLDGDQVYSCPGELLHIPGTSVEDCGGDTHDYFTWLMGGRKDYLSANDVLYTDGSYDSVLMGGDGDLVAMDNLGEGVANGTEVKQNMPNADVITMAAYNLMSDADKAAFIGWVIDDADGDGWAYWSQKVLPGESSGLLLDGITINGLDNNDYTYHIHVDFEAVDDTDLKLWDSTASESAKGLIQVAEKTAKANEADQTLLDELKNKLDNATDEKAKENYQAAIDALEDAIDAKKESPVDQGKVDNLEKAAEDLAAAGDLLQDIADGKYDEPAGAKEAAENAARAYEDAADIRKDAAAANDESDPTRTELEEQAKALEDVADLYEREAKGEELSRREKQELAVLELVASGKEASINDDINGESFVVDGNGDVYIIPENFPDPAILAAIEEKDSDNNGILTEEVTALNLNWKGVSDLAGLEAIPELTELQLMGAKITSIDLTKYPNIEILNLSSVPISTLNVSMLSQLKRLTVNNTKITSLDLRENEVLEELFMKFMPNVVTADLTGLTTVKKVEVDPKHQLTDLEKNTLTSYAVTSSSISAFPYYEAEMEISSATSITFSDNGIIAIKGAIATHHLRIADPDPQYAAGSVRTIHKQHASAERDMYMLQNGMVAWATSGLTVSNDTIVLPADKTAFILNGNYYYSMPSGGTLAADGTITANAGTVTFGVFTYNGTTGTPDVKTVSITTVDGQVLTNHLS